MNKKNNYGKREIIDFKMRKLNNLKSIARKRAYNNIRPLDRFEIQDHMKGQIYNGHVVEIAAFGILGVFQKYTNHYLSVYTSVKQDKLNSDLSIRFNQMPTKYIDIKSSFSYQVNRFGGGSNVVVLNYDETGFQALLAILDHIGFPEIQIRRELDRDKFFKLVDEVNRLWSYYMNEFNLNM